MTQTRFDDLLEVCKALANPTRLQIMGWLRDHTPSFATGIGALSAAAFAAAALTMTVRHHRALEQR